MFFIGQNLKHVHITIFSWTFDPLLINSSLDISCLKFICRHIKEILYLTKNFLENQSWSKNKHFYTLEEQRKMLG